MVKRLFLFVLILALLTASVACSRGDKSTGAGGMDNKPTVQETAQASTNGQDLQQETAPAETTGSDTAESDNTDTGLKNGEELLQSANVDLDGDGTNEKVEALQRKTKGLSEDHPGELEGILKIIGGDKTSRIPFITKQAGFAGVMSSFEFKDLDGDGAKDVFLIIPENGAAFSLNYFFAYSYKKEKAFSFVMDSALNDLVGSFAFKYTGSGKLEILNEKLGFTGYFNVADASGFSADDDESNTAYDSSWVEPTPVEIGENSRLALVKTEDGRTAIKVPLPVFGLATSDMIGELDLYYVMDKDFKTVLNSLEIKDFGKEKSETIGTWHSK